MIDDNTRDNSEADRFEKLVNETIPEPRLDRKQDLIDMMADDEKDGLYQAPGVETDPVDRTGTLHFNLPDASCDFKRAVNANQIATALYEICTNRKKWEWRMEAMITANTEGVWTETQEQVVDEFLDSIMADIIWTLEENSVHIDTLIE